MSNHNLENRHVSKPFSPMPQKKDHLELTARRCSMACLSTSVTPWYSNASKKELKSRGGKQETRSWADLSSSRQDPPPRVQVQSSQ